jgi:hypothetical protein
MAGNTQHHRGGGKYQFIRHDEYSLSSASWAGTKHNRGRPLLFANKLVTADLHKRKERENCGVLKLVE